MLERRTRLPNLPRFLQRLGLQYPLVHFERGRDCDLRVVPNSSGWLPITQDSSQTDTFSKGEWQAAHRAKRRRRDIRDSTQSEGLEFRAGQVEEGGLALVAHLDDMSRAVAGDEARCWPSLRLAPAGAFVRADLALVRVREAGAKPDFRASYGSAIQWLRRGIRPF